MIIEHCSVHRLRVDQQTEWVFLRLGTSDGVMGFGEPLLGGQETLLSTALAEAGRRLVGTPVNEAKPSPKPLAIEKSTGLLEATVHAAIDQGLWDLRARTAGLPLYRMLGPTLRTDIKLYANINRGTRDRSPGGFAERAAGAVADGFDAIKIAPFDGFNRANAVTPTGRNALATAIERITAVRDAIGPERSLMVDCHCRLDLPSALKVLRATESIRLDWFEDVLPYHDLDSWSSLRAASHAPLIGGESARGTRDLLPFLDRGIWDVLMPDIRFFGGVTELVALSSLAEQFQVRIAPHNPRGPVGTLASAHAMVGCPVFYALEFQHAECDWRDALTAGSERIENGTLRLGDDAGIGMGWDDSVAKLHEVNDSR